MRPSNVFMGALCLSGLLLSVSGCGQTGLPQKQGPLDDRPPGWVTVPLAEGFTVDMPQEPKSVKGWINIPNISKHDYVRFFVRSPGDQVCSYEASSYDATQEELQKRSLDLRFDGWVRNQFPNWEKIEFQFRDCTVRGPSGDSYGKDWSVELGAGQRRLIRTLAVFHGDLTKIILLRIDGPVSMDSPETRWFFESLRIP